MFTFRLTQLSAAVQIAIAGAFLSACGGASGPTNGATAPVSAGAVVAGPVLDAPAPAPASTPESSAAVTEPVTLAITTLASATLPTRSTLKPPTVIAPLPDGPAITNIKLESLATTEQRSIPLTFAQPFAKGHVAAGKTLVGKLPDGSLVPLQVEAKAAHTDGSVRHAVISAIVPTLGANATQSMELVTAQATAAGAPTAPTALLDSGFTAGANVVLGGQSYNASADTLLRSGKYTTWLSGPIVNEWHVSAPLTTASGVAHPHLTARFAIRAYRGNTSARVDVTIENNWAYEANPQNFVYDVKLTVGGVPVMNKTAMTHLYQARWRKIFWWGATPGVHLKHNTAYLIATKAVPNYDQTVVVPENILAGLKSSFTGAAIEPMGTGVATPYMGTTGGRPDMGLLPGWAATYLLTMDKRAKDVTLGTADLAGSWSSHYRNRKTDRPVSLLEYPYMTILGNPGDTYNPATKEIEYFPRCALGASCANSNAVDSAHQPGFAYLPYLVTGDYYYLEELQFWAMWNTFSDNPGYRHNIKGLFSPDQVRGQGWSMRTLSQAAYITPDTDPLKSHFHTLLDNNLDFYNASYTDNPAANKLGVITNGYAVVYGNGTGIAPWQDDHFTSAIGHANELGFEKAGRLLKWKSKFAISRMVGAGACWTDGSIYSMVVRDSNTSPYYSTIKQAYDASHTPEFLALPCGGTAMAASLSLSVGEMTGFSSYDAGFPSNMQPALAYSADVGGAEGKSAWTVFMGRSVKPNYGLSPQFAIVPR